MSIEAASPPSPGPVASPSRALPGPIPQPIPRAAMEPLNALWHLIGFLSPVLGLSFIATVLAKLVWRRELAATGWLRLWKLSALGCALAHLAALITLGRDGRMLGYVGLVVGTAAGLWWGGWGWRR